MHSPFVHHFLEETDGVCLRKQGATSRMMCNCAIYTICNSCCSWFISHLKAAEGKLQVHKLPLPYFIVHNKLAYR